MESSQLRFTNLCQELEWKDYYELFSQFGKVGKLYIDPQATYGSVVFLNAADALTAKGALDGQPPLKLIVTTGPPRAGTSSHKISPGSSKSSISGKTSKMHSSSRYDNSYVDADLLDVGQYVDVYGRPLGTLMDDKGEIYISLTDLRISGFDIFPGGARLPKFGETISYDEKLLHHHELFLKIKSKEFMIAAGEEYPQEALNKIIDKIQKECSHQTQQKKMENGTRSPGNQSYSQNRNCNISKSQERKSYPGQESKEYSTPTKAYSPNNRNEHRPRNESSASGGNFRGHRSNNDSKTNSLGGWNKASNNNRNENNMSMRTERNVSFAKPLQRERMDIDIPQQEEDGTHVVCEQKPVNQTSTHTSQNGNMIVSMKLESDTSSTKSCPVLRRPNMVEETPKKINKVIANDSRTVKTLRPVVTETIAKSGIFECTEIINDDTFIGFAMPITFVEEISMLDELINDCRADPTFKPNLGDTVAVLKDTNTYVRGIVVNNLDQQYTCALIDYGLTISVPEVGPLPDKYISIPEFAFVCKANAATIQEISKASQLSMEIETPSQIKVTIVDSGKVVELTASRWDPFETSRLAVNKNKPSTNVQKIVNKPIPIERPNVAEEMKTKVTPNTPNELATTAKPLRPVVIDTIAACGLFDCTEVISDDTFIAVAMPETFIEDASLLDGLTNDCKPNPTFRPNLGDTVAVRNDDGYVRGIVINNLNKQYTCALIDYGLTISVPEVCPLPDKYSAMPEFACVCKGNSAAIQEIVNGSGHSMAIETPPRIKVTLKDSTKVVEVIACRWDPFETSKFAVKKKQPVTNIQEKSTEKEEKIYKSSLKQYELKPTDNVIIISEMEGSLIVRTRDCNATLKEINQELNNYQGKPIPKPEINQLVICPFTDDGSYRGTVLSVNGPNAMIEYTDYGNCDTVPIKELKAISKKLANFPITCVKISLQGFVKSKFGVKALSFLEECAQRREKFNIVISGNDAVYDLLFKDESSLSEKLMAFDKLLQKPEVIPSVAKSEVCLPHLPPPKLVSRVSSAVAPAKTCKLLQVQDVPRCKLNIGGDIDAMCMFAGDTVLGTVSFCMADAEKIESKLSALTAQIQEHIAKDHTPYNPNMLEVCLAKFEKEWFRAAYVKEVEGEGYGMFYIDYGNINTLTSKDIRQMPKELGKIECLSAVCVLEGIKQGDEPIKEPLRSKLLADISEHVVYTINVIKLEDHFYHITMPSLYNKWKKEGLLS